MRTIKYKAKRIDNGLWVYGSYVRREARLPHGDVVQHYIYLKDLRSYLVDEKTICQFTGLRDKDGVEIYEGDILVQEGSHDGSVEYQDGSFIVRSCLERSEYDRLDECYEHETIIENIHDKT